MYIKKAETQYPYRWLDQAIFEALNPTKRPLATLSENQLTDVERYFQQEVREVLQHLQQEVYQVFMPKKVRAITQQYYHDLQSLLTQARLNLAAYGDQDELVQTGEILLITLEDAEAEIRRRYGRYLVAERPAIPSLSRDEALFKIVCQLSVDQLAIIFKAADDLKIILSRSLSLVFRSIVPYLSTPQTKTISWKSMRKSSYHPEQGDIQAVVTLLEKLIRHIREY